MQWHPWRALREMEHVALDWHDSEESMGFVTFGHEPCVTMTAGMSQAERRATLTHELIHLERGPCVPGHEEAEEATVRRLSAERLMPFDDLVEAMFWCYGEQELAEHFHVDIDVVVDRLRNLTAEETAYVNAEMDRREKSFGNA